MLPAYTVFGRVIRGQAVLDALAAAPAVATPGGGQGVPAEQVILVRVTISEG